MAEPSHGDSRIEWAGDGERGAGAPGLDGFGALAEGPYSTAKTGLDGYLHTFAAENREFGVRAVKLDPASMPNLNSPTWRERLDDPRTLEQMTEMYPMGWLAPDDFAGIVLFLLTPWARLINGVSIPIDGGMTGCGLRPFRPDGRWYMPMAQTPQASGTANPSQRISID